MEFGNQAVSRTFSGSSAGIGTSTAPATQPDESPSKIRDAVGHTEHLAGELHKLLSHLESRLDTALTPQPPPATNASDAKNPTPIASQLLERVYRVNDTLCYALQRVELLQQRVEV